MVRCLTIDPLIEFQKYETMQRTQNAWNDCTKQGVWQFLNGFVQGPVNVIQHRFGLSIPVGD
jgi:hypothetical protein